MGRFFLEQSAQVGDTVTIAGADANHIARVLRHRIGDTITLCDQMKTEYQTTIVAIDADTVTVKVESASQSEVEPPFCAVLYQALAKGDKMDAVVQKAVECGVTRIVPFESEFCVVKLDAAAKEKKRARWQKIAQSAAEQCGRAVVPTVALPIPYAQAVAQAKEAPCAFLCYEAERGQTLGEILPEHPEEIHFLVGPEGGFAKKEVELAKNEGVLSVGLGKRILRTETAASFVLSCLVYRYELQ